MDDASDNQSDGECEYEFDVSDYDVWSYKSETKVLLKKEPGPWIAHNSARLLEVMFLKLELPDHVYSISDSIGNLCNLTCFTIRKGINLNCLPHNLSTLLKFEWLQLENCPNLSQFPSNIGIVTTLQVLIIQSCGIKSLPHSLSLLKLRVLELNNCVFIQELPASLYVENLRLVGCHVKSFSAKPSYLGNLEIDNCLYVFDILTTLNHFGRLYALQIKSCDMESLPNSISGIPTILIEDCMNLKRLPENLSQVAYDVNSLTLVNCGLESIPSELRIVGSLSIKNCPIKSLDGCITGLTRLKCLTIRNCVALENLPTDINTLVTLQRLYIEGCTSIKFLPNIVALHHLSVLSLKGCSRLDELPADFDELPNLISLNLTDTNVQSLPSAITKLPALKNIHLPLSFRLDTLPDKFSVRKLRSAYKLRLKDQKNTPPNPTHLPQPIPGICTNLDSEESRQVITRNQNPLNGHLNLALTLQPFTIPEESWQDVFDDQTNSKKTLNLLDAFHQDEQVLAGTPRYLDEGRSSLRSAFINLDVGRNRMDFAHDGDGPSKQIEASEYWHGKTKHMMNNSRVMSQRESRDSESRDSESIDSTSHSVTSKALSTEATSLLRPEKRTMGRAIDDGHRIKHRKSQLGTRDGRCKSILSARQDGMFLMYTVWAKHNENEINFKFKAESSFAELKQELAERLTLEPGKLKIKYLDSPENRDKSDPNASIVRNWVLMTCDVDLRHCESYSLGMKILLIVQENQDGRS